MSDAASPPPALVSALDAVGDRWTLLLIEALLDGPARFGELQQAVGGIAPNVLSSRLKHLEAEGLVVAHAYSRRPPRFAYALTAEGAALSSALRLLAAWGARRGMDATPPTHSLCGTPLEARWWCPTCDEALTDPHADELRYA